MRLNKFINENIDWKKYTNSDPMLKAAKKVLDKISAKGYRCYIVGGTVRDIILGEKPHDVDICGNMPLDEVRKMFRTYSLSGDEFGIIGIIVDNQKFEYAMFRGETYQKIKGVRKTTKNSLLEPYDQNNPDHNDPKKYVIEYESSGRRPEKVSFNVDLKTDLSRRDLRINAMGIDKDGNIIDYFDGQRDIKNKIIRTVGNPYDRFKEDHLRIMRAERFAARLGFDIDPETKKAAKDLAPMIKKLSAERIREEIFKAASQTGDKFAKYLIGLDEIGVLDIILPEIKNLQGLEHLEKHHPEGGVWEHTLSALKQNKLVDPLINLSIAIHDIGKGVTKQYKPNGDVIYKGHDMAGLPLIDTIADRLKLSNKERDTLKYVVQNHMKVVKIKDMKPSKIAKLVDDPDWDILLATAHADEFSRLHKSISKKEYDEIIKIAMDIKKKWGLSQGKKALKLVDGNNVMKLTGLYPGKIVGMIIKKTEEWILDNGIKDSKEIDKYIVSLYDKIMDKSK